MRRGERLARYSFLGFGTGASLELYSNRLLINGALAPRPSTATDWSDVLRRVMNNAPDLLPQIEGLPFTGGLVGAFGYDVVRYYERLPPNRAELKGLPQAALVAPESVLVFDHLTRRVALLHSGSENERRQLRQEVIHALRGGVDGRSTTPRRGFSQAAASFEKAEFMDAVRRCKEYIAAGDIYQIVMSVRFAGTSDLDPFSCYRAMRLLNPSPYMFFFESGSLKVAGRVSRSAGAARPGSGFAQAHRGNAAARFVPSGGLWPWKRNCWRIRRKMPSMSCSWTWRETTWEGSRKAAACM